MKCTPVVVAVSLLMLAGACGRKSESPAAASVSAPVAPPVAEALPEIIPVKATAALTLAEVSALFGGTSFKIEDERNDPPAGYSTISSCRFAEDIPLSLSRRYLDLTVRTYGVEVDAVRELQQALESARMGEYPISAVPDLGTDTFIALRPATSGGAAIRFRKDKACFQITYVALDNLSDENKVALLKSAAKAALTD